MTSATPRTDDPVWYVAYASNLCAERLRAYLEGGRPEGALRTYEGSRDWSPPAASRSLTLPGGLVFAGVSTVWTGSVAFYDTRAAGEVAARGYLLTFGQLSDLVSQEARAPVGRDLTPAETAGAPWPSPSGVYESVVDLGERDGVPQLCLTTLRDLTPAPPSAAYLRIISRGLGEAFGWTPAERADYLLRARGVAPTWTRERLVELCDEGHPVVED